MREIHAMAAAIALTDKRIRLGAKTRPPFRSAYYDALALQSVMLACVNDPDASYADKAKAALAWERLEERKRILRNRPLPGSLKPEPRQTKRKAGRITMPEPLPQSEQK